MGKTFKKILCTLLVVVMCLTSALLQGFIGMECPELNLWFSSEASAASLAASGKCGDNAYWDFNNETGHLFISGSGAIYSSAFANKREIKSVSIGEGITNIFSSAFSGCYYLESVVLPESLVSIGSYAFSRTGLTALAIPKNVSYIGAGFVMQCNRLYGIVVHPDNKYFEILYSGASDARFLVTEDLSELVQYSCGHPATSIVIPDDIRVIRDLAFNCAWNLRSVSLPKNLEYIGSYAFAICVGLESIIIPKSIQTIDDSAFVACYQLRDVYINSKNVSLLEDSVCKQIKKYVGEISRPECYAEAVVVFENETIKEMLELQDKYFVDVYPTEPYGTIHCLKGSSAEAYAKNNGIDYTYIDGVYNLGEETYSFKNFGDEDSAGGHCFGMSATSSGYYLNLLDKSNIGVNYNNTLYSIDKNAAAKAPICHYQAIQGSTAKKAMLAGGTNYINPLIYNVEKDWQEIVNYVKNHEFDNKGLFQIGIRKKVSLTKSAGHAINFLRYEVVDGQERIYVYDNNFPNTETYFYRESKGVIKQAPLSTFQGSIDCIALRNVITYLAFAEDFKIENAIYAETDTISIKGVVPYLMDCDLIEKSYSMYEFDDETKIIITPLVENATFTYMDNEYSFNEINEETYAEFTLSTSEEDEPLFEVKNEPHEHIDSEWIVDKDSTCSAEGSKHIECTVCEEVIKTEAIEKLPHNYSSVVTEATCETGGYTTYRCTCGDSYVADYVDATGHSHVGTVAAPATHLTTGVMTYTCSACGDSYTEEIAKTTEHTYETAVTAPTCTAQGYTTYTCECGDSYVSDYVKQSAHSEVLANEKSATATEDGYTGDIVCSVCSTVIEKGEVIPATGEEVNHCDHLCHKDGILGFFWKIIRIFQKLFGMNPVCECGAAHY